MSYSITVECEYGNDERVRMVHHMFHKHGVEIEGIIKCPNEGCNYVAPQKCILLLTCPQLKMCLYARLTFNCTASTLQDVTSFSNTHRFKVLLLALPRSQHKLIMLQD